jgi:hypothetical protein
LSFTRSPPKSSLFSKIPQGAPVVMAGPGGEAKAFGPTELRVFARFRRGPGRGVAQRHGSVNPIPPHPIFPELNHPKKSTASEQKNVFLISLPHFDVRLFAGAQTLS